VTSYFIGIALLGVACGALTTVSGLGGGLLLVITLSALWGPFLALPTSALALLVGNFHRLALYRHHLRASVVRPLLLGLVPGSAIGAFLVAGMPALVLQMAMLSLVALALGRAVFGWSWKFPVAALIPAGGAVGVMAGAAGGAAVLTGPLVMASGVSGDEYLATMSMTSVAMHASRIAGYGAGGLLGPLILGWAGFLAVTLIIGNLAGRGLRRRIGPRLQAGLEYGALLAAAGLALAGIG